MVVTHLLGLMLDPLAQCLDGRAVGTPLCHTKLPQVCPRVAGQGFAIFKVNVTELAAGLGGGVGGLLVEGLCLEGQFSLDVGLGLDLCGEETSSCRGHMAATEPR